jgi:hypothetical protein
MTDYDFVLRYWRQQGTLQKKHWQEEIFIPWRISFSNMKLAEAPHGLRPHWCRNSFIHSGVRVAAIKAYSLIF